ncbi:Hypothetical predicted protein [Mytilus galloprovincialis]|uniref:Folate gamma-glutamyl hydrolase n=1 Tax=Mytilus galloprovincialis TaxID=29158 RepID=A0A8B6DWB1_MYTGA|nr:Hypothetical predicted protein [Mytilus galloprovincialis]
METRWKWSYYTAKARHFGLDYNFSKAMKYTNKALHFASKGSYAKEILGSQNALNIYNNLCKRQKRFSELEYATTTTCNDNNKDSRMQKQFDKIECEIDHSLSNLEKLKNEIKRSTERLLKLREKTYNSNSRLKKFFKVLSTNVASNGKEFLSTVEAHKYPVYGIQWHPEKSNFLWNSRYTGLVHDFQSIRVSQHFANFFISEARKNKHQFPSVEMEAKTLINNYPISYTADSSFEEMYFFNYTIN